MLFFILYVISPRHLSKDALCGTNYHGPRSILSGFKSSFYSTRSQYDPSLPAACQCDAAGSTEEVCTKSLGNCLCKEGYGGERCDTCQDGWWVQIIQLYPSY